MLVGDLGRCRPIGCWIVCCPWRDRQVWRLGTLRQCGHIGRLGEFAEVAVGQGMCFLATVNNHGFGRGMAPPGGIVARIGTNPLCLGAPSHGEPTILDIGMTVVAEGKVRVLFNKGLPAPEGWLIDAEGQPTTDPGVLYREPRGSILPLGAAAAYKGFGIGLLLDMFVGGLSGARAVIPAHRICRRTPSSSCYSIPPPPRARTTSCRKPPPSPRLWRRLSVGCRRQRDYLARRPGTPRASTPTGRPDARQGTWGQLVKLAQSLGVSVPT